MKANLAKFSPFILTFRSAAHLRTCVDRSLLYSTATPKTFLVICLTEKRFARVVLSFSCAASIAASDCFDPGVHVWYGKIRLQNKESQCSKLAEFEDNKIQTK